MPLDSIRESDQDSAALAVSNEEADFQSLTPEASATAEINRDGCEYTTGNPGPNAPRKGLLSWSFFGLLCLQFLTVLNDNTYRWLVTPLGYEVLGEQHKSLILTLGVVCFAVPYMIFMAPARLFGGSLQEA